MALPMRTLKTSEAAALLNVSPNTLRTWERRFGYPNPQRSPGRHRLYAYAEIAVLRGALEEGLSISSAISVATEAYGLDDQSVVAALLAFRADFADQAMEGSLALRSLERTLEEVLLPSMAEIRRRTGNSSATAAFAARWAHDWLCRAHRLAAPGASTPSILIGDATAGWRDPVMSYVLALELCCARGGRRS
jgi:DNA-binding transcriptional MerR regulator